MRQAKYHPSGGVFWGFAVSCVIDQIMVIFEVLLCRLPVDVVRTVCALPITAVHLLRPTHGIQQPIYGFGGLRNIHAGQCTERTKGR